MICSISFFPWYFIFSVISSISFFPWFVPSQFSFFRDWFHIFIFSMICSIFFFFFRDEFHIFSMICSISIFFRDEFHIIFPWFVPSHFFSVMNWQSFFHDLFNLKFFPWLVPYQFFHDLFHYFSCAVWEQISFDIFLNHLHAVIFARQFSCVQIIFFQSTEVEAKISRTEK